MTSRLPSAPPRSAWLLAGPTATGKTAVAHTLARRHGMAILSADSMLVYAGMDIGTAKPTPAERAGIPYAGIDLVSPEEHCSAGVFLRAAARAAAEADAAGRPLLVVGGTGLYFDLLLKGLDTAEGDSPPPEVRVRWQTFLDEHGPEALRAEAERRAPGVLARLADPRNPRRVQRVLERLDQGLPPLPGRPAPNTSEVPSPLPRCAAEEIPIPALTFPPGELASRIETRIGEMFVAGLLDEAASLRRRYAALSDTAAAAIGYAEAFAVLDGALDEATARERIAARTRQLAKRQRTWFRHRLCVEWIAGPASDTDIGRAADDVERIWRLHGPHPLRLP